jgi:hypothetical protein
MAASERALATPSIAALPNEILDRILSYIPMYRLVRIRSDNGPHRVANQAMLLMQVSRQFRKATQESRHWLDGNFNFSHLICRYYDYDNPLQFDRFLNILFDDEYLVSCLGRKTDWRFTSGPVGELIPTLAATRIPTFFQAVRKITLSLDQQSAWERLSGCHQLVELCLYHDWRSINLGWIDQYFPRVQRLRLQVSPVIYGSLKSLKCLNFLELDLEEFDVDEDSDDIQRLVPFESANTLTTVTLFPNALYTPSFDPTVFVNLRHASACYGFLFDEGVTDTLTSLDVGYYIDNQWLQITNFDLPCFKNLQQLTFHLLSESPHDAPPPTSDMWIGVSMEILENMVYLRDLKEIKLVNLGIDPKRVTCLSRAVKLETLTWILESKKQVLGGADPFSLLVNIFEAFNSRPKIRIITDNSFMYDRKAWLESQP